MPLEAQHLIVDVVGGIGAEIAGGDDCGVLRQRRDLVLVTDQQRQFFAHRAHPWRLGGQFVVVGADAPALGRTLALATEQQRQQLMTEADAQQLVAALVAGQQIGLEGFDPRVGAEGVGLAARHQVGVERQVVAWVLTLHHVVDRELGGNRLLRKQVFEHLPVALILVNQFRTQVVGFQNADA
ncbi:hypothetical protein D3C86_1216680 [compost metagenome]